MQNYIAALLSNIAYIKTEDFTLRPDGTLVIYDMEKSGITESELSVFNDNFKIEYQKNGTEGFSAMKIVAIKTSDFLGIQSGDVTIAFRGTEPESDDWITDIGMGIKAISDLTPKIINEGSQYIPGLIGMLRQLGNLPVWDEHFKSQSQQALDYFNVQKNLSNNITVVGHSLGGYLANYVTTTGDNYTYINETRTFNAPGFNASRMAMLQVQKDVESLLSTTTNLTDDQINELMQEVNNLSIKIGSTPFNPDSFSKLNPFFGENGPKFTSNDIVMFVPESVNKIPIFITPQINPIKTHGIGLLTEATAFYDSLNLIMSGSKEENYKKLTDLLNTHMENKKTISGSAFTSMTRYIFDFLGADKTFNNTSDIFKYISELTTEELNRFHFEEITALNYNKSSAHLYALINLSPFIITNDIDMFENTIYDITQYTQQNIDDRYNLFNKYNNLKEIEIFYAKIPSMHIYENYTIIYDNSGRTNLYVIVDEHNKRIITNDYISISGISNEIFDFVGDDFDNIQTTYLKSNQTTLLVNTLNNIVHDTRLDDYIALNKGSTNLDLSYGSDTINIEISNGAKINNLTIKDGGIGDLFIFNGGQLDDYIIGTQYNDNIIGNNGNDTLNGLNGDDKIYGGNGDDSLIGGGGSNYLEGGDGDDTLNDHGSMYEYNDIRGDTLNAGKGINTIYGTGYGDTYLYSKQDGYTTIHENNTNSGFNYIDRLVFDSTIQGIEVSLFKNLYELIIAINGIKKIFIIDYFNNYNYLEEIHFTDIHNTIWYKDDILSRYTDLDEKILAGSSADDNLQGGDDNEDLDGRDGNDIIRGGKGNDVIFGGDGNDTIYGEDGDDRLNGNDGNDTIYGGIGVDIINGDNGDDKLYGDAGDDFIYGGEGVDTIYGGLDNDFINGENGDDKLNGDAGNDTIFGGNGNDTINGNLGDDKLNGDNGSDIIYGGDGNDTINGGNHNDTLNGDAGNDVIYGGEGDDTITGGLGNDTIYGDDGDDKLNSGSTGTSEFDKIYGGNGKDTITNTLNNTYIRGGNDNDIIVTSGLNVDADGESGDDVFNILTGSGVLKGGEGSDQFSFYNSISTSSKYTIEGGLGNDTIYLDKGFESLIYNRGDGEDKIMISGTGSTSQTDSIRIQGYSKNNITSDKFSLFDNSKSLKLKLSSTDSLSLVNFLTNSTSINNLKYFQFDDGTLTSEDLIDIFTQIKGTDNNDNFYDTPFNDTFDMSGTGGVDYLYLKSGFDTVYGGDNITVVYLQSSNNIINSGSGTEQLTLSNSYSNVFNLKDSNNGHDTINIGSSAKGSKIIVNLLSKINIADMKSNYYYTLSWENNSSLTIDKNYINNQVIFNNEIINVNDLDLIGDSRDNYLKALTDRNQYIRGNGGVDQLYGGNGNDHIFGGTGGDKLYGEGGDDTIYGDEGEDFILDLSGNNTIWGGADKDNINTGSGNDTIHGGDGNDSITSGGGIDTIYGDDGDDTIGGNSSPDSKYYGGNGNDKYNVGGGYISDNYGLNTLIFGAGYRDKVDIISTGNGFNVLINGVHTIAYNGEINRIERHSMPPSGYETITSLVGTEINKLFELQASLATETDDLKITSMKKEISALWGYEIP